MNAPNIAPTFDEVEASLNKTQQGAVSRMLKAQEARENSLNVLYVSVATAADKGIPARFIAQTLGVTRSRTYQMIARGRELLEDRAKATTSL